MGISAICGIWSLELQAETRRCAVHWKAVVFCSLSKDVEWRLRQERGVFGVQAEGHAVEVEKEEH